MCQDTAIKYTTIDSDTGEERIRLKYTYIQIKETYKLDCVVLSSCTNPNLLSLSKHNT